MTAQTATAIQIDKGSAVPVRQGTGELLEQFDEMYDAIARRAFELFESNGRWPGRDVDDWLSAEGEMLHPMHIEIRESDSGLTVQAEVPGFSANALDISVEPRMLKITGKREAKQEGKNDKKIYSELCSDQILRAIDLPADVDPAKASATLKDGILTISLSKAATARSVRVEPQTA